MMLLEASSKGKPRAVKVPGPNGGGMTCSASVRASTYAGAVVQSTDPFCAIDETAVPEEHVPLTRVCTDAGSTLRVPEPPSMIDPPPVKPVPAVRVSEGLASFELVTAPGAIVGSG
jgi:hypothetical protein